MYFYLNVPACAIIILSLLPLFTCPGEAHQPRHRAGHCEKESGTVSLFQLWVWLEGHKCMGKVSCLEKMLVSVPADVGGVQIADN